MKAQISDSSALRSISPAAIRAYIESQGWSPVEKFGAHSQIFSRESNELIVPGTPNIADYPNVIADLIGRLSGAENRDQLQIFRDLTTADKDVIRIRTPEADDDGSVPIEAGVDLVVASRDLLLSAACSAWKPQAVYRAGKVAKAEEYMHRVRLGQTEHGSFIITLLAPVPPALQPSMFSESDVDQPFERRVTCRLSEGLDAAALAVEKFNLDRNSLEFDNAVDRGVSANLCDAISQLASEGNGIDVSITWARTRPNKVPRWKRHFTRSEGEMLGEVARNFKLKQPRPDERLEGFITDLHRDQSDSDGRITLRTTVDGKQTSVKLKLSPDEYAFAIQAHDNKTLVSVEGELIREGHRWQVNSLKKIERISEEAGQLED